MLVVNTIDGSSMRVSWILIQGDCCCVNEFHIEKYTKRNWVYILEWIIILISSFFRL